MRSLEEAYAAMPNRQSLPENWGWAVSCLLRGEGRTCEGFGKSEGCLVCCEAGAGRQLGGPLDASHPGMPRCLMRQLEVLAFNSLPAAVSDDHWTHQNLP